MPQQSALPAPTLDHWLKAVSKIGTLIIHLSLTGHQVKDLPPVDIGHPATVRFDRALLPRRTDNPHARDHICLLLQ